MKYIQALKELWKDFDPFLHLKAEEIVDESKYFFVIPARAPYIEDHLLIIPKRKVYVLRELNNEERLEMYELLEKWSKLLHTKHSGVNLLLRDWLVCENYVEFGKSINHLHFHLVPDCPIWAENLSNEDRRFFDDEEYINITKNIKKTFLGKQ